MHAIVTRKRELFYWAAILFTFVLTALAYYVLKINGVLAFWIAYILTRPLGASTGDSLSQPVVDGGLGLGTTLPSAVFLSVIVGLVIYLTKYPEVQAIASER